MTADNKLVADLDAKTDEMRREDGVNAELFGYLHPQPDHNVKPYKLEGDPAEYLRCETDGKISGPVTPIRVNNS